MSEQPQIQTQILGLKKFIQWWIDEDTGLPIEEKAENKIFYRESYTWGDSIDEVMKLNSKGIIMI